jgi:uncharacterized cupin superfamily protein
LAPLAYGDPAPRPVNNKNVDEVEQESEGNQTWAGLANRDETELAGMAWERVAPGKMGSVPHCHSAEEEIFVILEGSATLHLWPSPLRVDRGATREEQELRPGHVVARPPGTGVSHFFIAGPDGCAMLVYGTRDPNDMCFYPRSNKISWRGVGVIGRIEHLDYWDGEPLD